jgi:hypothetical protein
MRKVATLSMAVDGVRRVMVYATDDGAYLFLYTGLDDGPCTFDEFYDSPAAAQQHASERFHLTEQDWAQIDDPLPGAQHDWIRPTRVKRDQAGNRLSGQFEPIPQAE